MGTLLAYSLAASSIVGSLLIVLRCVYVQDKALSIGFWLAFTSIFVYVPGKLGYQKIADATCKHWGRGSICHLHDTDTLGNFFCYLTAVLLILGASFEILLWFFCHKLNMYGNPTSNLPRPTELQEVVRTQEVPLLDENSVPSNTRNGTLICIRNRFLEVINHFIYFQKKQMNKM